MSPLELAVAALAVAVGALVQGSVGFGLNLIAAPILILVDPRLVPGPAIVIALVLTVLMGVRERRSVDLAGVRWAVVGRVPGTIVGALAVAALSSDQLGVAFGALVLVAVGISALGLRLRPTRITLVGAGALSGLMGTTSSIGGPPIAMVYASAPGATVRGTLSAFFVIGASLSIITLGAVGEFGTAQVVASLVLIPPLLAGFALSRFVAPHLDAGHTRAAVLAVSTLGALSVLARSLA